MTTEPNAEHLTLHELRQAGYAVAVFTPDEIGSADPDRVEDAMIEAGWRAIEMGAHEEN